MANHQSAGECPICDEDLSLVEKLRFALAVGRCRFQPARLQSGLIADNNSAELPEAMFCPGLLSCL